MATGYQYRPLDPARSTIRVLEFRQAFPADHSKPLTCSLKELYLGDTHSPPYSAISYCWGTAQERKILVIEGVQVSVPRNAELALRYLHARRPRPPAASHTSRPTEIPSVHYLWLDAICINQGDLQERNRQVALMADVYSQAEQALIWLGEDEGNAAAAVAAIQPVLDQCRRETDDFKHLTNTLFHFPEAGGYALRLGSDSETLPGDLDWDTIVDFFSIPWFTRLWVVQEIALARCVYCFHGHVEIDFMNLIRSAAWIIHRRNARNRQRSETAGIASCMMLYCFRRDMGDCFLPGKHEGDCRKGGCKKGHALDYLLSLSQDRGNTEPRDKVYGILGLANDSHEIPIDYSLPLAEVFAAATRTAIASGKDISAARASSGRTHTPGHSWVPMWDRTWDANVDPHGLPTHYQASASYGVAMEPPSGFPRVLSVYGICLDEIEHVSDSFGMMIEVEPPSEHWRHVARVLANLPEDVRKRLRDVTRPHGQTAEQAICLTLAAGVGDSLEPLTVERLANSAIVADTADILEGRSAALYSSAVSEADDCVLTRSFSAFCRHRRLFVTQQGWVGLGPKDCAAGDFVCTLYGGSKPFVIRHRWPPGVAAHFVLLGECYVHDEMHGKTLKRFDEEGVMLQRSTLCEIW
ncbi:hypothetical protein LTR53_014924 [Teratosphaeriaceae sp. CCFEE 6253]|nr:hypothetical protein LTR53_014924 [Teratosphaeriaceae sp. CCFEE 6253]